MIEVGFDSFVFKVTHCEEWKGHVCVSRNDVDLKVVSIPASGGVDFRIWGKLDWDIEKRFTIKMSPVVQMPEWLQYGMSPEDGCIKEQTVPQVCRLYANQACIRFDFVPLSRVLLFYGHYDERAEVTPVEQFAHELFALHKENVAMPQINILGKQWLRVIEKNPVELLYVHDPQFMTYALPSVFEAAEAMDSHTRELVCNVGYWCLSKAMEMEPHDKELHAERLSFMIASSEEVKRGLIKVLNYAVFSSGVSGSKRKIDVHDAVCKMMMADLYFSMNNKPFVSQYNEIKDMVDTGERYHRQLYSDLTARIQHNDF